MDEDKFNMSMRKFLKQVGVTSQHAIERQVREQGLTGGRLKARMVLTIEGQRSYVEPADGERHHRVERRYGAFRRSFTVPGAVDASRIAAAYQDGVLTITLPRREEARPRQIQING